MSNELPARARAVLGLHQMGWENVASIANIVFNPARSKATERQKDYVRRVLRSKDPRVQRVLRYGIRYTGAAQIARPVTCPRCRTRIDSVPCVACHIAGDIPMPPRDPRRTSYVAAKPRKRSKAEAGSAGKIRIMRDRVARGDSPFHPDDLVHRESPRPVETRQVAVADLAAAYKESCR